MSYIYLVSEPFCMDMQYKGNGEIPFNFCCIAYESIFEDGNNLYLVLSRISFQT